jgi:hypothetical protein
MSMHHSVQTHHNLLPPIPQVTGRALADWIREVDAGPGLTRFEERVNWLRYEFNLPHNYASAIVHEHDLQKAARAFA